jgi:hypothetical protein
MVESGRKHGAFDFRYPVRGKIATPVWELRRDRDGPVRLEWSVFLARFFPKRLRHDSEALAAYEAYRNALDRAASPQGSPPHAKRVLAASGAIVAAKIVSESPALADWESEGGSVERDAE